MNVHLPSLRAIQTFEAAARHLSLTRAAEELNVTPGAVSRQIRTLEDLFGAALFERQHRGVRLTHFGSSYYQGISHHFAEVRKLTEKMMSRPSRPSLHLICSQSFAIRWLMPRLPEFHRLHPQFDVTLATSATPLDIRASGADIAIRLDPGPPRDTVSYPLVSMPLMPVCSPAYLREIGEVRQVSDLERATLLNSLVRPGDWQSWLEMMGASAMPRREMSLENSALTYQAAVEGLGFALAQTPLIRSEMERGLLVAPIPVALENHLTFYLIFPRNAPRTEVIRSFEVWVTAQVAEFLP